MVLISRQTKLIALSILAAFSASAATISFVGPVYPKDQGPGKAEGTPCNISDPKCILGEPSVFEVFGAQLTQPMGGSTTWTLTIETNYGPPTSHLIPGSPDVVPPYVYAPGFSAFSIGDFLIQSAGVDYAIVLHPHDGYAAGSIYKASGYQTAAQVTMGQFVQNPTHNVELAAGGMLVGTGTLTGAETGDSVNTAHYTLTDTFMAPANFLTSPFTVDFSSYACANGVLEGSGGGFTGGTGGDVPEPMTALLVAPILAGAAFLRRRKVKA